MHASIKKFIQTYIMHAFQKNHAFINVFSQKKKIKNRSNIYHICISQNLMHS